MALTARQSEKLSSIADTISSCLSDPNGVEKSIVAPFQSFRELLVLQIHHIIEDNDGFRAYRIIKSWNEQGLQKTLEVLRDFLRDDDPEIAEILLAEQDPLKEELLF